MTVINKCESWRQAGQLSWPTAAAAGEDVSPPQTVLPVSNSVSHIFRFRYSFSYSYSYSNTHFGMQTRVGCAKRRQKSIKYLCSQLVQACGSCICLCLCLCHSLPLPLFPSRCHRRVASNVIGSDSCIMILLNCA